MWVLARWTMGPTVLMLSSDRFLTEIHKNKIQQNNKTNPSPGGCRSMIPPNMLLFVLIIAHWRFYKYILLFSCNHIVAWSLSPCPIIGYYLPPAILLDFLIGIETTSKLRKLHTNTKLLYFIIMIFMWTVNISHCRNSNSYNSKH